MRRCRRRRWTPFSHSSELLMPTLQGVCAPLGAESFPISSAMIYGVGLSQICQGGLWCDRGQVSHWPTEDCGEGSSCIPPVGGTGGCRGLPCKLFINPLIVILVTYESYQWNVCTLMLSLRYGVIWSLGFDSICQKLCRCCGQYSCRYFCQFGNGWWNIVTNAKPLT